MKISHNHAVFFCACKSNEEIELLDKIKEIEYNKKILEKTCRVLELIDTKFPAQPYSFMNSSYKTYGRGGRFRSGNKRPRRGGFRHSGNSGGGQSGGRKKEEFNVSQYINRNPVQEKAVETYIPTHAFTDFGLRKEILTRVEACGFKDPTPIQDQIISLVLEGRDVVGLANTGTGKTAAFLIPLIQKTLDNPNRETLIMAPTRELAIQIEEELKALTRGCRIWSTVCVGGVGIGIQLRTLRRKNNFIIGTPGRLLDLINRKALRLQNVETVVLDEADRMLDMGFIHDMKAILSEIPEKRQTLFFSATMQKDIELLIKNHSKNSTAISVKKQDVAENIEQDVVRFGSNDKVEVLSELLSGEEFRRVLVFGRTKHGVEKLSKKLARNRHRAESIHGNKSHNQRQRALKRFKNSEVKILVATDVAARGLDIHNISHVINFDLPTTYEDYVHRIGRTGRGEKRGKALTLIP
ncbi:ATP-dependent RNA helicase RhlE [bacterium]|nr:ATP-dependent RNA helicase RhlE [bacterium]|tara:strand:- start:2325 stop:3725 length:1401 start_codon:yes stop_codon:yes gene_type:complete